MNDKHIVYDPELMWIPTCTFVPINVDIMRPTTPFPGQLFTGQKYQSVFNAMLIKMFNEELLNLTSNERLIEEVYESLKYDFPDRERLKEILIEDIPKGTFMNEDVIEKLKNDIMDGAYAKLTNWIRSG